MDETLTSPLSNPWDRMGAFHLVPCDVRPSATVNVVNGFAPCGV